MDFTIKTYKKLLTSLVAAGYVIKPFGEYISNPGDRTIILRHDVDRAPGNSLIFSRIQHQYGIRGSYYFRVVPQSFDEKIVKEIFSMGHEIGYHYEDFFFARQRLKRERYKFRNSLLSERQEAMAQKLASVAIESFKENLTILRNVVPIETVCMHGTPLSRWDSRLLWKYYDYKDYGIKGEPYFDLDLNKVLYLTDTGRCWDGERFNIRDKFPTSALPTSPVASLRFHTTYDIIRASDEGLLPDKIMMTFHPQRWTGEFIPWLKELIFQNVKNVVKYLLIRIR